MSAPLRTSWDGVHRTPAEQDAWNERAQIGQDQRKLARELKRAERVAASWLARDADLGREYALASAGRENYRDDPAVLVRFLLALVSLERIRGWLFWHYPDVGRALNGRVLTQQAVEGEFVKLHEAKLFDDRLFALLERDLLPGQRRPLCAMLARYARLDEFADAH